MSLGLLLCLIDNLDGFVFCLALNFNRFEVHRGYKRSLEIWNNNFLLIFFLDPAVMVAFLPLHLASKGRSIELCWFLLRS